MQQTDKEKALNEIEEQFDDLTNKKNTPKVVEVVDTAKDVAGKAADFVSDAAKVAGDFAGNQLKNAKVLFDKLNDSLSETKYNKDLEKYKPIFKEKLETGEIVYPEMINVVENDKRMGIEACYGAIGFEEIKNDVNIVGIYKNYIDKFNIDFYPNKEASVYYRHPFEENKYIKLNEYFVYLKEARVAELKNIAQSLGAKHFKVSIMEEKTTEISKKANAKAKLGFAKDKAGVDIKKDESEKQYELIGIASESKYDNTGKEPVKPELKFWKNSIPINNLIEQRLSKDIPLTSETYRLDYNTLTGIDESQAAKIDGALKALKFEGAGSISEKAKEESKRKFEYTIEF